MTGQPESIEKSSLLLTVVHSVTTSGLLPPSWKLSWKLTVIDWACLRLSESTQETRWTHNEAREKTTSSLLPLQMIVSGIDCISFAQLEYLQKARQIVSTVALTWSEITLIVWVMLVQSFSTVCQPLQVVVFQSSSRSFGQGFSMNATVPHWASRLQAFPTVAAANHKSVFRSGPW